MVSTIAATESVLETPLVIEDSAECIEKVSVAIKVLKQIGVDADADKAKDIIGIRSGKVCLEAHQEGVEEGYSEEESIEEPEHNAEAEQQQSATPEKPKEKENSLGQHTTVE
ncbi:hypothetical protein SAY87_010373 [Trapa incisa]|uniref:Uncharacterized protein n=1 Tax=Trapa incisa TaxID=236973 RepID=A0AAN7GHN1_9MYRT|nr:hypothetical protein SAY87_010373 [Trapa incisa]